MNIKVANYVFKLIFSYKESLHSVDIALTNNMYRHANSNLFS